MNSAHGAQPTTKKRFGYASILAASAAVCLPIAAVRGELPTSDVEAFVILGQVLGLAFIPMLLLRFGGPLAAAVTFVVLAIAYLQGSLHLL